MNKLPVSWLNIYYELVGHGKKPVMTYHSDDHPSSPRHGSDANAMAKIGFSVELGRLVPRKVTDVAIHLVSHI